jgi:hypothetical protein
MTFRTFGLNAQKLQVNFLVVTVKSVLSADVEWLGQEMRRGKVPFDRN